MHSSLLISKYTYYYDGIYEYDPELKMKFMKPNFKAKMFWGDISGCIKQINMVLEIQPTGTRWILFYWGIR